MKLKDIDPKDIPKIKTKDERLREVKGVLVRAFMLVFVFLLTDILVLSPMTTTSSVMWLLWFVRVTYSFSFVLALHNARTVYLVYTLEEELRNEGIHTQEDLKREHQAIIDRDESSDD